jgi:macrolide-specific efflux system membrane fusion protein
LLDESPLKNYLNQAQNAALNVIDLGEKMAHLTLSTHRLSFAGRLLLLVAVLSLALSACSNQSAQQEEPTPTPLPTPVIPTKPTYTVQTGEVLRKLEFTGRVVPVIHDELFFKSSGRVDKVLVKKGEKVTAGQLISNLESGTSLLDLRRAEINLEMAKLDQQRAEMNTPKYLKDYNIIMAMQKYQVELAQISLDELKSRVESTQIVAPFDGTVLSIFLTESTAVEGYKPVVVVADLAELEISADLADKELQSLEEGMAMQAWPVSAPGKVTDGTIRKLPYPYGKATEVKATDKEDKTSRFTVNAKLEDLGLGLGDIVRVVVVLEKNENALWLPPQAIRNFEGRKFVVVKDGDGQRRVDVKTGITGDDRVEILDGLTEGQVVVAP